MQQVAARDFADARLVDPRQLPVPLSNLSRRTSVNFRHVWVLHRKLILRGFAAVLMLGVVVGLYEARGAIVSGATALSNIAQGEFARAGFGIGEINITGQSLTSEADILKALAIGPATSTLNFDAEAARDDGSFRELPLIVGEGANDDSMAMIRSLERHPLLRENLAALSRIGDRRWDLIFYSGLRVQLPELGVAQALDQLEMYQAREQLLDRDVNVIDMRVPGMVSLKLGELSLAASKEDAKKAKTVVKGDAEYETPAERAAESKPQ